MEKGGLKGSSYGCRRLYIILTFRERFRKSYNGRAWETAKLRVGGINLTFISPGGPIFLYTTQPRDIDKLAYFCVDELLDSKETWRVDSLLSYIAF